jgi:hypothetical protein
MADKPTTKLVWRATIKRATMTQKFTDQGAIHSTLQLVCEGDMILPNEMSGLALLQRESLIVVTLEPAQVAFDWTIPTKGETNAEVPDQSAGSGGNSAADQADDLGVL